LLWAFFAQCVIDMVIKSLTGGGQIHLTRSCLCLELGDLHSAGEWLEVRLYWQGLAPMREDYTVFVHLTDAAGRVVAQRDSYPLRGNYPTSDWPVGVILADRVEIPIPPDLLPGEYTLKTGMYLLSTLERLPVADEATGEKAVVLGTVIVR